MKHNKAPHEDDNQAALERKCAASGFSLKYIVGGAALVLAGAALIINLPDIKRYIRISTM